MELNRNHFFVAGMLIVLLGVQFRMVDAFVLNESTSRFLAQRFGSPAEQATTGLQSLLPINTPPARKTIRVPHWLGWAFLSVGSVLVLYSLAMQKPESK